jgi:SAM-dependent methyltransferase
VCLEIGPRSDLFPLEEVDMQANEAPHVTPERIMQLAWGFVPPLVIEAAINHRIFDALDAGPMTVDELQCATCASRRGVVAIANALVGFGLLTKSDGRYALSPESAAFLVSTKPSFQGGMLRHISKQLVPQFLHINEVVASGNAAAAVNREEEGSKFFTDLVLARALGVAEAQGPVQVLDLAAGSGVWGIAIAQASPQVYVTAVDWPVVLPITRKTAERFGLGERFSFREGDLGSADFGTGYQVATLGHILHSEGEPRSRALLKKVFAALAPGGTIAIAEFLVNADRTGPPNGLIFAVNMLVNTDHGDTFSFEEISTWLAEAGFVEPRLLEAPGPSPLVLATKPR